jgi:hypothetical protein
MHGLSAMDRGQERCQILKFDCPSIEMRRTIYRIAAARRPQFRAVRRGQGRWASHATTSDNLQPYTQNG